MLSLQLDSIATPRLDCEAWGVSDPRITEGESKMCLGIPGRVMETYQEHGLLMGKVDFGGVSRPVCLEHVPAVELGNYVIVHVGFALSIVDEAEARQIFSFLAGMNELDELQAGGSDEVLG